MSELLMPSCHDHGNCELCDWQEERIRALEAKLEHYEMCAESPLMADVMRQRDDQAALIERLRAQIRHDNDRTTVRMSDTTGLVSLRPGDLGDS